MTIIHEDSKITTELFEKDRYVAVKSGLSKETIDLVTQYALFDEMQRFTPEAEGLQVPGAHSRYADPMMESILLFLLPKVEEYTGLELYPTYSYYRVYRSGDKLDHHKDRPACEISITLSFEYNYKNKTDYKWPIYMNETPIYLEQGEMAIYHGCELDHWREPFEVPEGSFHVQAFLHYVDKNGINAEFKYDKRDSVGVLNSKNEINTNNPKNVVKNYIQYT